MSPPPKTKIERYKEPKNYGSFICNRCKDEHCVYCVELVEVDFMVKEDGRDMEGESVCVWCYNQLADKFENGEVVSS